MVPESARRRPATGACWLMALVAAAFAASVFWPGMLSNDAAYMWWQARGGPLDTIHSPAFVYLWRVLAPLADSPAPVFLLQLGLFWAGLAMVCAELRGSACWRLPCIVLVGVAPPVWIVMAQLGTDAAMLAALTLATGMILRFRRTRQRRWQYLALTTLLWAAAMRHNALPAVVPLVWLCWPVQAAVQPRQLAIRILATAMTMLVFAGALVLIGKSVPRQLAVWPATVMWDIAAISIAQHRVLLPKDTVGPGMTSEDLASAYVPWANTPLFTKTRAGVRPPFLGPQDGALKRELLAAWWHAVRRHPGAYLRHRWQLVKALFGRHPAQWPRELVYFPVPAHLGDNPPVTRRTDPWHRFWLQRLAAWRDSLLLAAWPWLLAAVPALMLAAGQRRKPHARAAMALLGSGALLALPLVVIAPAAELRYLAWPVASSLLALVLATSAWIRQQGQDKLDPNCVEPAAADHCYS